MTFVFTAVFLFSREKWYQLEKDKPEEWARWNNLKLEIQGDFKKKKRK
jgi:hypothetical protein